MHQEMTMTEFWRYDDDDDDKEGKDQSDKLTAHLLKSRTILVAEAVSDKLYQKVARALTVLEQIDDEKEITVLVNSPGGSADSGFAIYDLLRFSNCPIRSIANGIVASAAVPIFLGADEGQTFSMPHARFLLHQPSMSARGQASDLEITAREILKIRKLYNKIVEKHTGRKEADIEKDSDRDFWLSASEAKEYGLVKKIVERRKDLK